MLLGRIHAIHVCHCGAVHTVIVEHFAEQPNVSGIILDQKNSFDQLRHLLCACTGKSIFCRLKSIV
jgi:hypothetical protein